MVGTGISQVVSILLMLLSSVRSFVISSKLGVVLVIIGFLIGQPSILLLFASDNREALHILVCRN